MAHHGNESWMGEKANEFIANNFAKTLTQQPNTESIADKINNLGATGNFPDGKLKHDDEGEIQIGITSIEGRVVIDFGKPTTWVGLTKEQAKSLAETLLKHSE